MRANAMTGARPPLCYSHSLPSLCVQKASKVNHTVRLALSQEIKGSYSSLSRLSKFHTKGRKLHVPTDGKFKTLTNQHPPRQRHNAWLFGWSLRIPVSPRQLQHQAGKELKLCKKKVLQNITLAKDGCWASFEVFARQPETASYLFMLYKVAQAEKKKKASWKFRNLTVCAPLYLCSIVRLV